MRKRYRFAFLAVTCLLIVSFHQAVGFSYEDIDPSINIKYFSDILSRVTGYEGCDQAAEYITQSFKEIGISDVEEQRFKIVIPVDMGAILEIPDTSETIKIRSVWPNHVSPSKAPPGGIEGQLLYAGDGDIANLNGRKVEGSIVLIDFNCSNRWLDFAMLGAKAIIFIEPSYTLRDEAETKFVSVPISVPRFWISQKEMRRLSHKLPPHLTSPPGEREIASTMSRNDIKVKITGGMRWEEREGVNIIGYLKGREPKYEGKPIVISAYYDSISNIPGNARGAEASSGAATLIEMAKFLANNRPKRPVKFLVTSGHFEAMAGIRAYLADKEIETVQ